MEIVYGVLVVAHLVGMAAILGSWMVARSGPRVPRPMADGAYAQVLTGLLLVGLAESGTVDADIDNAKIAVKLLVALVVAFLVVRNRRKNPVGGRVLDVIGGLALLNVAVAVLW